MIPFNKEIFNEDSIKYVKDYYENGTSYKRKVINFVKEKWNFDHVILTTSCTHALEAMAMILDIGHGDEILVPSYTFVSTANAFVKFGATIKCIDSRYDNPNIDEDKVLDVITDKTKALVVVHYGGWACNMDKIVKICEEKGIYLLEDAAQAINSYYHDRPLGSFGVMSAFSFHGTKNIGCGEGGMLVINDPILINKAEIVVEKGTNRYEFSKGFIDKYEWVEKGSSYPLAEINSCFLYPQMLLINEITYKRKLLWNTYKDNIEVNDYFSLCPKLREGGNYHIFYLIFKEEHLLKKYREKLLEEKFVTNTHYKPLHKSKYYRESFGESEWHIHSENYSKLLLRFPLFFDMKVEDVIDICKVVNKISNIK